MSEDNRSLNPISDINVALLRIESFVQNVTRENWSCTDVVSRTNNRHLTTSNRSFIIQVDIATCTIAIASALIIQVFV
ncbi:hypothetical protein BHU16_11615 [Tannerella sp. oral taxon 808]|nr:hypothetical protein BHU16_11615 [Tannerella sp. oral taxon 808]PNE27950.1 hypothetical protein BHU09_09770 [Tannerella sp. oral taxon 808]